MKKKAAPVAPKLNIRTGDDVVVITGKSADRKTVRKVIRVIPSEGKVVVEGVNVVKDMPSKRTQRAAGEPNISEKTMPIHASNVMLVDPKSGKATRVRRAKGTDGKVTRVAVKSGETI